MPRNQNQTDLPEGYQEPNYRGVMQDMEPSFSRSGSYTLTPQELEVVFLCLIRLGDLERFGYNRDWEAIETYCPREEAD